jgi:hypothetical protein
MKIYLSILLALAPMTLKAQDQGDYPLTPEEEYYQGAEINPQANPGAYETEYGEDPFLRQGQEEYPILDEGMEQGFEYAPNEDYYWEEDVLD